MKGSFGAAATMGVLGFVLLSGIGWVAALGGLGEAGYWMVTGLGVLAAIGALVAGRSQAARGFGAGLLVGFAISLTIFSACYPIIEENVRDEVADAAGRSVVEFLPAAGGRRSGESGT